MSNEEKELKILEYLEGELPAEEEARFRGEIERDPELRSLLEEYQHQDRLLHGYFEAAAPAAGAIKRPALESSPSARVNERPSPVSRYAAMAAGLAVLAGAGAVLYYDNLSGEDGITEITRTEGAPQLFAANDPAPRRAAAGPADSIRRLKTPDGSFLTASLSNGGTMELRENSLVSVEEKRGQLYIELERGEILVQTASSEDKTNFVHIGTPQFTVSTINGAVSVTRGLRGGEAGVIDGQAEVRFSGQRKQLAQGESFSSTGVRPLPLIERVSWSERSGELIAMLPEDAIPSTPAESPQDETLTVAAASQQPADEMPEIPQLGSHNETHRASAATAQRSDLTINSSSNSVYLPEDTFFLAEASNVRTLLKSNDSSDFGELILNDTVRGFIHSSIDNVEDSNSLSSADVKNRVDEIFANNDLSLFLESLNGGITFGGSTNGFLAIADVTSNYPEFKAMVENRFDPWLAREFRNHNRRLAAAVENGKFVIGKSGPALDATVQSLRASLPTGYADDPFMEDVRESTSGSYLTLAVDAQKLRNSVIEDSPVYAQRGASKFFERSGLASMRGIIAATNFNDQAENRALRMTFDGERGGVIGWLGEPGPLSGFQFFSSDTHIISAARIARPEVMLRDVLGWMAEDNPRMSAPETTPELALVQSLAATLGNEMAVGLDNPVLPVPNVKLAVEVLDPIGFQTHMANLIMTLWEDNIPGESTIDVETETYRGKLLVNFVYPGSGVGLSYAIVEDFVVLGPGAQSLRNAIDVYEEQQSLMQEYAFIQALPAKSGSHASALVYVTVNNSMGDAMPYLEMLLENNDVPFSTEIFTHRPVQNAQSAVYYAIAQDDRIDLFAEGVKGQMTMGGFMPAVTEMLTKSE